MAYNTLRNHLKKKFNLSDEQYQVLVDEAKKESKMVHIEQRLMEVEQGVGAGGETPKKGLAQRLDDLEARIVALESK